MLLILISVHKQNPAGCGLRNVHIPYHVSARAASNSVERDELTDAGCGHLLVWAQYPSEYGELYPPASTFPTATHPVMGPTQPLVGWYRLCKILDLVSMATGTLN